MRADDFDWARVAEPQPDGYDTGVALALAKGELGWDAPPAAAEPHAFDGSVALRPWRFAAPLDPALAPGSLDDPTLRRAEVCVKTAWPLLHRQFAALVAELAPMDLRGGAGPGRIGSHSGHTPTPPFAIYVTCFDAFGTAESLVHEMAHIKLRCLGLQVESASRLIVNRPAELYCSPLRSYPRPMTALFHAFYSWLHITELDLRWAATDPRRATLRVARNCDWMETMGREIAAHVRTDAAGERFLPPLFAWAGRLLTQGRALLRAADAAPAPAAGAA